MPTDDQYPNAGYDNADALLRKLVEGSCRPNFVLPMVEAFVQDKVSLEELLMAFQPVAERKECRAVQSAVLKAYREMGHIPMPDVTQSLTNLP